MKSATVASKARSKLSRKGPQVSAFDGDADGEYLEMASVTSSVMSSGREGGEAREAQGDSGVEEAGVAVLEGGQWVLKAASRRPVSRSTPFLSTRPSQTRTGRPASPYKVTNTWEKSGFSGPHITTMKANTAAAAPTVGGPGMAASSMGRQPAFGSSSERGRGAASTASLRTSDQGDRDNSVGEVLPGDFVLAAVPLGDREVNLLEDDDQLLSDHKLTTKSALTAK